MKSQGCRYVGQINGFYDHITHFMIDDAWCDGQESHPNELGF